MLGSVMSELRLLSSVEFDSKNILTVVLSGDARLLELFHQPELLPLASRIRVRLSLDYQAPDELANFLRSLMTNAGNPQLMTDPLVISHVVPRSTILDRRIMPGVKCLRRWRRVG